MTLPPQNTTREVQEFPMGIAAASIRAGGFGLAINEQERAGQAQLVNSTVLPVEGSDDPELAELGFTFGDPVPGDDLFREATLPEGWKREGSDHAMHSYIVDERGIRRVNIFYKAAFYDRRADLNVLNVGHEVASKQIYGDDPVHLHDQFTADELGAARADAAGYLARAERSPEIYGDRVPRAEALIAAIDERLGNTR